MPMQNILSATLLLVVPRGLVGRNLHARGPQGSEDLSQGVAELSRLFTKGPADA